MLAPEIQQRAGLSSQHWWGHLARTTYTTSSALEGEEIIKYKAGAIKPVRPDHPLAEGHFQRWREVLQQSQRQFNELSKDLLSLYSEQFREELMNLQVSKDLVNSSIFLFVRFFEVTGNSSRAAEAMNMFQKRLCEKVW